MYVTESPRNICSATIPTAPVNSALANNSVQEPRPTAWIKILQLDRSTKKHIQIMENIVEMTSKRFFFIYHGGDSTVNGNCSLVTNALANRLSLFRRQITKIIIIQGQPKPMVKAPCLDISFGSGEVWTIIEQGNHDPHNTLGRCKL